MTSSAVRWITSTSWELPFFGLPSEIPWPEDVDPALASKNPFEIEPMLDAIRHLGSEAPEVWQRFLASTEFHDDLAEAIEDRESQPALAALGEIERLQGDTAFVLFHRAHVARTSGSDEEALRLYRAAGEKAPQVGPIWGNIGSLLALRGERDEAIAAFRKALSITPEDRVALEGLTALHDLVKLRGTDANQQENFHYVELATFAQIADQQIHSLTDPDQLVGYGEQLLRDGTAPLSGVKSIERASELKPGDPCIMLTLSAAYRHTNQAERSRSILERFTTAFPSEPVGFLQLAQTCHGLGDETAERTALARVLELDPNSQPALAATFRVAPGEHDPAVEDKLSQWGIAHRSWMAHLLASAVARTRGDSPAVFRHATRAMELAPENEEVLLNYAGAIGDKKEIELLAKVIKPAVESGKYSPRLAWTYAHVLHQLGMRADALLVLRNAAKGAPEDFRQMAETTIEAWTGTLTGCGVRLETHAAGFLPRPILIKLPDGDGGILIAAGTALPAEARFPWRISGANTAVTLQQGETGMGKEPLSLGAFAVRDIRQSDKPTIDCHLVALPDGAIHFRASQAGQKLPVGWMPASGMR